MVKVEPMLSATDGRIGVVDAKGDTNAATTAAAAVAAKDGQGQSASAEEEEVPLKETALKQLLQRMDRIEKENKQLQDRNKKLEEKVDAQALELELFKQRFVVEETKGQPKNGKELDQEEAEEEEGEEAFWALVKLPRPSEASPARVALQAYLYTLLHAVANGTLLVAWLQWFPVTDFQNASGVPVMNVDNLLYYWLPLNAAVPTIGAAFNVIGGWESGVRQSGPWTAAWPAFPICIVCGILTWSPHIAALIGIRKLGIDFMYLGRLDAAFTLVTLIVWLGSAQFMMRKAYWDWGWGREENKGGGGSNKNRKETSPTMHTARRRRSSVIEDEIKKIQEDDPTASIMSTLILVLGMTFNCLLYPTLIIPYINADTTTDTARIFIISIVLSALTEATLIIMRFGSIKTSESDFNIRAATGNQNLLQAFESTSILARRILLGCMRTQRAVFTAIGIMSLEEAVLRSTFPLRELWYRKFRGVEAATDSEMARLKVGWAVQIANSMHAEIFSIFMSKLLVIVARYDRYSFNVGFQSSTISFGDILLTMVFELLVELVVDYIALNNELGKDIPVHWFYKLVTKETVACQMFFFAWALYTNMVLNFPSMPLSHFCTSPTDPCTCTGGPYRIHRPLCLFLSTKPEEQAALLSLNATEYLLPDLPRVYIKTIVSNGNETSYAIDLDYLKAEHGTLFSIVSSRNQELVYAGAVTLGLVVIGMLFSESALSRFAKKSVKEVSAKVSFHAGRIKSFTTVSFAKDDSPAVEEKDD